MGIQKTILNCAKAMFKNPSRKNAKLYEQAPMLFGFGYTGVNLYKAVDNLKNNNKKAANENLLEAYTGMATIFGSMFGVGGAILVGGGVKYLCEKSKQNLA